METFADAVEMSDSSTVKGCFKIAKSIEDKRIAFGWASIVKDEAGNDLVDLSDDIIEPDTLENAAYEFVKLYREGGEMHERGGCATLVESIVFTPEKMSAMGIPDGTLPTGWWIGFHVTDDEVWSKVKSGEYPMFSIEGEAVREPV